MLRNETVLTPRPTRDNGGILILEGTRMVIGKDIEVAGSMSPQEMVLEKVENRHRDERCEVKMSSKSRD